MHQPLAYIHPQSKIAKNVVIEPFVTIEKDVEIGEGTWIGPNVTIMEGTRIGKNCRVFPGAVIGAVPQDLKFNNEYSTAEIGDNVTIRECVTINRGTSASGETRIGKDVLIMATVHIAHDCVIGDNAIIVNGVALAGHVTIGDYFTPSNFCARPYLPIINKLIIGNITASTTPLAQILESLLEMLVNKP